MFKQLEGDAPHQFQTFAEFLQPVSKIPLPPVKEGKPRRMSPLDLERQRDAVIEDAKEKGHQEGFAEGHAAGLEAGRQEAFNQALEEFRAARDQEIANFKVGLEASLQRVEPAIHDWFNQAEEQYGEIAIDLARRILHTELSMNRESSLQIVREAIKEVTHSLTCRIKLNPFDSEEVAKHKAELIRLSGNLRDIEIVEDTSIVGGCLIETEGGVVDARIESQILSVKRNLKEAA